MKRSNLIVSLGLAVFIIGAATTYLLVKDNGDSSSSSAGKLTVLYAADDIGAGTTGAQGIDNKLVKTKTIEPSALPSGALTDASQLAGRVTGTGVPKGSILTNNQFSTSQTRIGTLEIPPGKTALTVGSSPTFPAWPASQAPRTRSTSTASPSRARTTPARPSSSSRTSRC